MKKRIAVIIFILVAAAAVFTYTYQNTPKEDGLATEQEAQIKNEITLSEVEGIELSDTEKEQLKSSVDAFMNEYKLPKGVQNSYVISIEKILGDAIEMVVNPLQEGDLGNIIIHARKTNGVWQVDPSSGPWCTLEQFESSDC